MLFRSPVFNPCTPSLCLYLCLQGNVDPVVLFGSEAAIEAAVRDCLSKAGERGHVLNLGHGVLVGTPEVRAGGRDRGRGDAGVVGRQAGWCFATRTRC